MTWHYGNSSPGSVEGEFQISLIRNGITVTGGIPDVTFNRCDEGGERVRCTP